MPRPHSATRKDTPRPAAKAQGAIYRDEDGILRAASAARARALDMPPPAPRKANEMVFRHGILAVLFQSYYTTLTSVLARMVGIVGSVLARVRSLRPVLSRRRPIGDAGLPPPNTGRTIHFHLFLSFVLIAFVQFVWLASEPTVCEHLERVVPGTVPVATDGDVTHVAHKFFCVAERVVLPPAIAARFRCS